MTSITDVKCSCHCGWTGIVDDCIPDVDRDGSLGCPSCYAVLVVVAGDKIVERFDDADPVERYYGKFGRRMITLYATLYHTWNSGLYSSSIEIEKAWNMLKTAREQFHAILEMRRMRREKTKAKIRESLDSIRRATGKAGR